MYLLQQKTSVVCFFLLVVCVVYFVYCVYFLFAIIYGAQSNILYSNFSVVIFLPFFSLCALFFPLYPSSQRSTLNIKKKQKSVEININVNASTEMKTKYGSNENIACVIVYTQHMNRNSLCFVVLYDFLFACQFAFFFQFYGF